MHPPIDSNDAPLRQAADYLRLARRVAVLTGAGVSAESGIPTFRAADGLWEGHRIEDVATPEGFRRDPALVWKFYNARRENVRNVKPNPGHSALSELEKLRWEDFVLITQNVDGLHRASGSQRVLEIHGSLHRTRCTGCNRIEDRGLEPLGDMPHCPHCEAMLRPAIVWFHETLPEEVWGDAMIAAAECDVLLVVGTSAVVHPAASLIPLARNKHRSDKFRPAKVIEANLTRTDASHLADVGLYGPSGVTLPQLLAELKSG